MVERKDDKAIAFVFEAAERPVLQFNDIAGAGTFVRQADQIRAPCDQALCGKIGVIVECGRGFLDLAAHRFADMGGIVKCARNGLGGDPRDPRNIDDR